MSTLNMNKKNIKYQALLFLNLLNWRKKRGQKNTVKPVNKGHPMVRQNMVFIDKWSLIGGHFV